MTYATAADRYSMSVAPAVKCACGHWAAVHVIRGGSTPCTVGRCICLAFSGRQT